MQMRDFRAMEKHFKVLEAAKRLERDGDIKGITVQVIFWESRGNEAPVQMFIPSDHPAFTSIMDVVNGQLTSAATEAQAKVDEFAGKVALAKKPV